MCFPHMSVNFIAAQFTFPLWLWCPPVIEDWGPELHHALGTIKGNDLDSKPPIRELLAAVLLGVLKGPFIPLVV